MVVWVRYYTGSVGRDSNGSVGGYYTGSVGRDSNGTTVFDYRDVIGKLTQSHNIQYLLEHRQ